MSDPLNDAKTTVQAFKALFGQEPPIFTPAVPGPNARFEALVSAWEAKAANASFSFDMRAAFNECADELRGAIDGK